MALWIVLSLMTVVAALIVVVPMVRARREATSTSAREIAVYADQLAEVGRDLERGLIGETESAAARTEISRRILRADQSGQTVSAKAAGRARPVAAIAVCVIIPLVAVGLYSRLGSPEMPDEPLAARKATPVEQLSPEELVARLDQQLAAHPDDVNGWDLAGPIYMRMGRFADAVNAFQTAIRLGGPDLRREGGLGEALTSNAQGVVTAEARSAFEAATKIEPHSPLPKMYLALALSQDGRLQESADAWKAIVASAPGGEPWAQAARKELADVEAKIAKQNGTTLPASTDAASPNAPSGAPDGTQAMIESMVAGLQQRLETQGGTAEDWGKLIKSYMVLGRADDAKSTYAKAKVALASDPAATTALTTIATDLGVPQ